jgi:hypothetical protein
MYSLGSSQSANNFPWQFNSTQPYYQYQYPPTFHHHSNSWTGHFDGQYPAINSSHNIPHHEQFIDEDAKEKVSRKRARNPDDSNFIDTHAPVKYESDACKGSLGSSSSISSGSSTCSSGSVNEHHDSYFVDMFNAYQAGMMTKARYKRLIANERERRRMHALNDAFENLRAVLPDSKLSNRPSVSAAESSSSSSSSRNYSKFETLRTAWNYILALREMLDYDNEEFAGSSYENQERVNQFR